MKKIICLVASAVLSVTMLAGCGSDNSSKSTDTNSTVSDSKTSGSKANDSETNENKTSSTAASNSKKLRLDAAETAKQAQAKTPEDEIKNRLIIAWGDWQPDYDGWVKWSNGLYTEDATISAIGSEQQSFKDYQGSMKLQRDAFNMEMGPIMNIVVKDNVAALVYHMYMTPKNSDNASTVDMVVTEYNTVNKVNGKLMVTHLDLYTDGGGMQNH